MTRISTQGNDDHDAADGDNYAEDNDDYDAGVRDRGRPTAESWSMVMITMMMVMISDDDEDDPDDVLT